MKNQDFKVVFFVEMRLAAAELYKVREILLIGRAWQWIVEGGVGVWFYGSVMG